MQKKPKKTCGTFLENFMHMGIPKVICSNQGTNFKSQLTQEFQNRLGTWPTSQLQHIWSTKLYVNTVNVSKYIWMTCFAYIQELKFTVNVKKCVFTKSHIEYLGHLIGASKYQPYPEKLHAAEMTESPKNKTSLKSAHGLFNYYFDCIRKYSEITKSL